MGKSHEEKNARGETDAAFIDRMEKIADGGHKWGPESAVAVPARTLAQVVERVEAVAERLNPADEAELRAALDPLRP